MRTAWWAPPLFAFAYALNGVLYASLRRREDPLPDARRALAGYVAFLAMDICGSVLAFTLDHKPLRWLPLLLIQRFTYRQIMYYVCFKAMIAAVKGARHGWRKLDRTGSVNAGQNLAPA